MAEAPGAAVFDLDGTLIDSAPSIRTAVNAALAGFDRPPLTLAETTGFIGNGLAVLVRRVMEARAIPDARYDEMLRATFAEYRVSSTEAAHFYPGVPEMLARLTGDGVRIGICTNKPLELARAILEASGVAVLFPVVIGGDSLPVRKPDPAPLRIAIAGLGQSRAVFVGDSEIDSETASRAGVPFLLFSGGYARRPAAEIAAAARFDRHEEVPALVHWHLA